VQTAGVSLEGKPVCVAFPAGDALQPDLSMEEIEQRAMQPGPLRLIFVGNLIARKGLHTLLNALERLPEDACRLTVVGRQNVDPAYSLRIHQMLRRSPQLQRMAIMKERLDDAALRQAMSEAQVMVAPSQYEGFGIVYLEGMGFGLPAIGSTAGAAGEIITHGEDGFLVQPEDPEGLAQVLRQMAERMRLKRMARAARERYMRHPTWQQSMDRAVDFLESIGKAAG
jgi:glycosyltransferase involved in cell wall biosynthesis